MIMTSAPGLGRQDDQNAAVDRRAVTASADTGVAGMRRRVADGRERLERLLLWRVWERMLEIEFVDRSVALAGKAFVSFFPLVIVVAAFVPDRIRSSIITTLTNRLGIRRRRARTPQGSLRVVGRRSEGDRRRSVSCSRSSSRRRSRRRCSASTCARGGDRPRRAPARTGAARPGCWRCSATWRCSARCAAPSADAIGVGALRDLVARGDLSAVVVHRVVPPLGRRAPARARSRPA